MAQSAQELFEQGCAGFRAGNLDEVAAIADAFCTQAPAAPFGWFLAAVHAAASGHYVQVCDAVDGHRRHGGDGLTLAEGCGRFLLDEGRFDALIGIRDALPAARDDRLIWIYFAGCAHMMRGDDAAAMACFDSFDAAAADLVATHGLSVVTGNANLSRVYRQGRLCAGPATVAERLAEWSAASAQGPAIDVAHRVAAGDHDGLFMTACNGIYFNHFGADFTSRVLARRAGHAVHIHVADPDAETFAGFQRLAADHPGRVGLSVTRNPPHLSPTYFTCERFFVVRELLDTYDRTVVSLDLDVALTGAAPDMHALADRFDFCCFETGRNEPASACQASAMVWANTSNTRRFLDHLNAYCWPVLAEPPETTWMLDQAALFSVRHYVRINDPDTRFGDIGAATGISLQSALETFVSDAEKSRLKEKQFAALQAADAS